MRRRPTRRSLLRLLPAGAALGTFGRAAAQAPGPPAERRAGELWFDPTQLPSFTGTVERHLINPAGETDALLFREGPQIVFPPDIADVVRQAAAPGRPLIVWGVRARSAPVITMLAFAPSAEVAPRLVERPYWRLTGRQPEPRMQRIEAAGAVRQPYWSPQGEVVGAVLEDGTVVLLPSGAAAADGVRDLLRQGAKLAAEGPGSVAPGEPGQPPIGRALIADRLGDAPGTLRPVPTPPTSRR
jgi:hypothetical protein